MKFRKASDIALVAVFAAFLAFPAVATSLHSIGLGFPEWLSVGKTSSPLEGRTYTTAPKISRSSIASGNFQKQTEKYLSDIMPMRDDVILTNAAVQRKCIELASAPKGYKCYPTYFGSTKLAVPKSNAVVYLPSAPSKGDIEAASNMLSKLDGLALDYPNTTFVVYAIQGGQYASTNPAYSLCTTQMTGPQLAEDIISAADTDRKNVFPMTKTYDSEDEFFLDFFRTDHHWNSRGAISAYNDMAEATNIARIENPERIQFDGYRYSGATARWGLDLFEEEAFDLGGDGSGLVIVNPDGTRVEYSHEKWHADKSQFRRYRFHDEYYDYLAGGEIIENKAGKGSALLICDSYGADLVPMLGAEFNTLSYVKDLHSSAKTDKSSTLRALLEKNNYDCVYLVAGCANYIGLAKRSPNYLT